MDSCFELPLPGGVHSSEFHLTATPAALQRSNERCLQDSQKEGVLPSESYCWVDTDRHALCARVLQNRGAAQHSCAHSMVAAAATSATATRENNKSVDAYTNALWRVPGLWRRPGGLTGDAEQQRRPGSSKRALGPHALRMRWSLLRELRANVMMKQHRCNGQIKIPSSCSLMRDCRANYIQNAVCHGAAPAVTCSA